MSKYIKIKNEIEHETIYLPKDKIMFIRTDIDYETDLNDNLLNEWCITFYFEDPEEGQPHPFWFDTKEEIQKILKQLEE